MEQFKQRYLFTRKKFIFKEDGVEMFTKELDGEFSKFIHFNAIEPRSKARLYTEKFPKILYGGGGLALIALVRGLFRTGDDGGKTMIVVGVGLVIAMLTVLVYFVARIKYYLVELDDETQIFVLQNRPNEKQMQEFVDELYSRRKTYYRENYFFINYENTREKETGKMKWLRDENLITDSEYMVVMDEINDKLQD